MINFGNGNAGKSPVARGTIAAVTAAAISALLVSSGARADDISDLKTQMRVLNARLMEIEQQKSQIEQQKAKIKALNARLQQVEQQKSAVQLVAMTPSGEAIPVSATSGKVSYKDEEGGGPVSFWNSLKEGRPVHIIETEGTDVRLYGLLEASFAYQTNQTKDGKSTVGMEVSWFSGNRWGLEGGTVLDKESGSKFIFKLESEYELPTGNMDTGSVLFNRDAWVGFQSETYGKLTVGRQNTLPRDFAQNWGDAYGTADVTLNEGGWTNNNNFKQLIFYTGGGSGAHGQGDTRLDNGIVWKKKFENGLVLGAAYAFSDGNGPGGPNGSGSVPGAGFDNGSVQSLAAAWNHGNFNISGFYNHTDVLERAAFGDSTTKGLSHQSAGIGGNVQFGIVRWNVGYIYYTAEQGAVGTRTDNAVTTSIKITPPGKVDYELGWQNMFADNAALNSGGSTFNAYQDASGATKTGTGTRMTTYGSVMYHPVKNLDLYVAGDWLKTTDGYSAAQANGHNEAVEVVTGARYKF
jgi:predicted porin